MRPITVIRAVLWAAIAVTGWSLSLPWGDEIAVGKGPPSQWERHVVGAALLLLLSALAIAFTSRKKEAPGALALLIAAGGSFGALALALGVRSTALENQQAHILIGGGWLWMTAGACMAVGAVVSAFTLLFRPPAQTKPIAGNPGTATQKRQSANANKRKAKKR